MKKYILLIAFPLLIFGVTFSQSVKVNVFDDGGGLGENSGYKLQSSIGQGVSGVGLDSVNINEAGYITTLWGTMNISFGLTGTHWELGTLQVNEFRTMNASELIRVYNDGDLKIDLGLQIVETGSLWSDAGISDTNEFSLSAIFNNSFSPPEVFYAPDLVYSSNFRWAELYFGEKGYDLNPSDTNNVWFRISTPSVDTSGYENERTLRILLKCRGHLP